MNHCQRQARSGVGKSETGMVILGGGLQVRQMFLCCVRRTAEPKQTGHDMEIRASGSSPKNSRTRGWVQARSISGRFVALGNHSSDLGLLCPSIGGPMPSQNMNQLFFQPRTAATCDSSRWSKRGFATCVVGVNRLVRRRVNRRIPLKNLNDRTCAALQLSVTLAHEIG